MDIIFGRRERKHDFSSFNRVLLIAKQHLCYCRYNALVPSYHKRTARIKAMYELGSTISKTGETKTRPFIVRNGACIVNKDNNIFVEVQYLLRVCQAR